VDPERAKQLLQADRLRVERDLQDTTRAAGEERSAAGETGDYADPAESLTAEQGDDAVTAQLRRRLSAIDRAEERLRLGTYGFSIRSGLPISDERLEADPAAELTVEEREES
jgi:DnaK suppressor protein